MWEVFAAAVLVLTLAFGWPVYLCIVGALAIEAVGLVVRDAF